MKKKTLCAVLAVIMATGLLVPVSAATEKTIEFQNNNEIVSLVFSDVLAEGAVSKIEKDAEGFSQSVTPLGGGEYIDVYSLTVPLKSTVSEVLLTGSHGRYTIIVEGDNGETIDFSGSYTLDDLDIMILTAALAGNEAEYKALNAIRDAILSGTSLYLTTLVNYSGPKDKYSGLQRRQSTYEFSTAGEYTLWFLPESSSGASMAIRLSVNDGTTDITPPAPPSEPESPATPEPPTTAYPTSSTVYVNGENVSFDAYSINDNNYFKLRDLAFALSGSDKQFEVTWDEGNNAIGLISGTPYTVVGGEMTAKGSGNKSPVPTTARILLDGSDISLTAYNIDGNNYFKLRDVGKAFNFNVSWDGANNAISINTAESYTDD